MKKLLSLIVAASFVNWPTSVVQAQVAVENQKLRVELIGLKRWTLGMIQDSLARYAPKDSLLSHSCAAVLRDKLKFADASVNIISAGQNGRTKDLVVVTVIEPGDSALVRYRPEFKDSLPDRIDWLPARHFMQTSRETFQRVLQTPGFPSRDAAAIERDADFKAAAPLHSFLRSHNRRGDQRIAIRTLERDGNWKNRLVAIAILLSFGESDATWRALAETLRDPDSRVGGAAGQALHGLAQGPERSVNWKPSTRTLRALINGTSISTFNPLAEAITRTRIDPRMASALLKGEGGIVLAKLTSSFPYERELTHQLVMHLSGESWPAESPMWRRWIRSL